MNTDKGIARAGSAHTLARLLCRLQGTVSLYHVRIEVVSRLCCCGCPFAPASFDVPPSCSSRPPRFLGPLLHQQLKHA